MCAFVYCSFSITVQEKIEALNDRLERECYGSGERSLPAGDFQDYTDSKTLAKQKCELFYIILLLLLKQTLRGMLSNPNLI